MFAGALTIIAAVGSFALAKKDGRLELLMVLPVVLSGLVLLQAHCVQRISQLGDYIRDHLWPRLPIDAPGECPVLGAFLLRCPEDASSHGTSLSLRIMCMSLTGENRRSR